MSIKNTLRKCRTGAVLTVAGIGLLASGVAHAEEVVSTSETTPVATNAVQDTATATEVVPQSAVDAGFESKAEVEQAIDHVDSTIEGIDTQSAQPDYQPETTVTLTNTEVVARVDELATEQVALTQEVDATRAVIASNEQELESARAEQTQAQNLVTQAQSAVSDAQQVLVDAEASTPAPSAVSVADVDAAVRRVEETQNALAAETNKVNAERVTEEQMVTFGIDYAGGNSTYAPIGYRWPEADIVVESGGSPSDERQFTAGIYAALDNIQKANGLAFLGETTFAQLADYNAGLIPSAYTDIMKRRASASAGSFLSHAGMVEDGLVDENAWYLPKNHANGEPKSALFLAHEFVAATVSELGNVVSEIPFGHAKTTLLSDARMLWIVPAVVEDPDNPSMYRVAVGYFMKDGASGSVATNTFAESKDADGRIRATIDGRPIALSSPIYEKTTATRSLTDAERASRLAPYQDAASTARADYEAKLAAYQSAQVASTTSSSVVSDARQNLNRAQAVLATAQSNLEVASAGVSAAEQALSTSQAQLQSLLSRLRGIESELVQLEGSVDKTVTRPEVPGLTQAERAALEEQRVGLISERARLVTILNEFGVRVDETQPVVETQSTDETAPVGETNPTVDASTSKSTDEPVIYPVSGSEVQESDDATTPTTPVVSSTVTTSSTSTASEVVHVPLHTTSVVSSTGSTVQVSTVVSRVASAPTYASTASQATTSMGVPTRRSETVLPETGTDSGLVASVLGGIVSSLGLAGLSRRKK